MNVKIVVIKGLNVIFNKHLLGNEFGFAARDLVYIYQDIQKEFGISIPDEEVANEGLSSINKILEMLVGLLNTSERVGGRNV